MPGRRKMAKHFQLAITDASFSFARGEAAITREAALDGFYVLRTSVPEAELDSAATVLSVQGPRPRRTDLPPDQDGGPRGAPDPPPIPDLKLVASYGQSNLYASRSEVSPALVRRNESEVAAACCSLTKWLTLVGEYAHVQARAHNGNTAIENTFTAGGAAVRVWIGALARRRGCRGVLARPAGHVPQRGRREPGHGANTAQQFARREPQLAAAQLSACGPSTIKSSVGSKATCSSAWIFMDL